MVLYISEKGGGCTPLVITPNRELKERGHVFVTTSRTCHNVYIMKEENSSD